jgi:hypothetical protein
VLGFVPAAVLAVKLCLAEVGVFVPLCWCHLSSPFTAPP